MLLSYYFLSGADYYILFEIKPHKIHIRNPETEHNFSAKTASGPSIEILDISNKQASTIAELCNEQMLEQNWSILYGENNRIFFS